MERRQRRLRRASRLAAVMALSFAMPVAAKEALHEGIGVGDWIWDHQTRDRQEVRFVRAFEIPRGVKVESARLRMTADNSYQVFLDGQAVGRGGDWRVLIEYDLSLLLEPGEHVLAVSALNDFDVAGLLLGLRVEMSDGRVIEIASGESWKIAPNDLKRWNDSGGKESWPAAKVLYPPAPEYRPMVYLAPVSQPVEIAFWQRTWFQLAVAGIAVAGLVNGVFLASRLILKSKVERMVRDERARIAADLHDGLGGGLTQLVLLSDASSRAIPPDSHANETLDRLRAQTRELVRGMNEAVWLVNSQRDNLRDFAAYLGKYAESFFAESPVRCRFDIERNLPALPCDIVVRRNLFLAFKEALNNILRHSRSTGMQLTVRQDGNGIRVVIADNGRGFDPSALDSGGNGLENMRKRVRDASGTFKIETKKGGGCMVTLGAPLLFQGRKPSRKDP